MSDVKWQNLRELFLSHLATDLNLSENTIAAYDADLIDFFKWCRRKKLDSVDQPANRLYDYLLDLRNRSLNPATIARRLSTLKHLYKLLVSEGIVRRNPAASIEGPRLMRRLPQILDQSEMEQLLSKPKPDTPFGMRDRALLELWYACGLRISEVRTIRVEDLMLELRLLRVLGKGRKERMVPFGSFARDACEMYIEAARPVLLKQKPTSTLFLNNLGGGLSRMGLWKILKKYTDMCEFSTKVKPHTIRHSCATHLIEAGADIRTVMELLGHADISTTQIYTHLDREYLREVHKSFHPRA